MYKNFIYPIIDKTIHLNKPSDRELVEAIEIYKYTPPSSDETKMLGPSKESTDDELESQFEFEHGRRVSDSELEDAAATSEEIDTYILLGGAPQGVQEQSAQELAPPKSQRVRRTTRLSFECHPDLILGDVLNELYGLDNEDIEEPLDEDLCCETCPR